MSVIDDYLEQVSAPQKKELERIRKIICETAPGAEEVITYGMPGFKYQKKYLIAFAAFKGHLSIFPGAAAVAALKKQLSGYATSKGTIQFTLEEPLPDATIKAAVLHRMEAIAKG